MNQLNVTVPFLPPRDEFDALLTGIWERKHLTNDGPLVQRLEQGLREKLGVSHLRLVANGTLGLLLAIEVLGLGGDVITTPFTYIATASSLVWQKCVPIFADIEPDTFNISPASIAQRITPETTAILATHVFGNPCDVRAIDAIARENSLRVIYDAAHAFGVLLNGKSVLQFGDLSVVSMHATKVFHTVEGGAVVAGSSAVDRKVAQVRNFGHDGPEQFSCLGINAKMSELHAAMGLANLAYVEQCRSRRMEACNVYKSHLSKVAGIRFQRLAEGCAYNYPYMPVLFETSALRARVAERLAEQNIHARRYFLPSLDTMPLFGGRTSCVVSQDVAERVLCLPLSSNITLSEVREVCSIVQGACLVHGHS